MCWVLVTLPNSLVLEIELDSKGIKGQDVLDKVCRKLGIIEVDYFGLKYEDEHGDLVWINMRNPLRQQISGSSHIRLKFAVKFYVPPHLILQDTSRHQFYLQVKSDLEKGLLKPESNDQLARLVALISHAEMGDFRPGCNQNIQHHLFLPMGNAEASSILVAVATYHKALKGLEPSSAEYRFLQEASALEAYGVESFMAKTSSGKEIRIQVGATGISLHNSNHTLMHSVPYSAILTTTHVGKSFFLQYVGVKSQKAVSLRLESSRLANSLYRVVTEKHAFYSCDTVRNAVTAQFIRDLKGTIASLFNENTPLGKKYVFDIRRTCREVYDNTRRHLYQINQAASTPNQGAPVHEPMDESNCDCSKPSCVAARDKATSIEDAMMCKVCLSAEIQVVFVPCGHVACCQQCADKLSCCPLCRTEKVNIFAVYLPISSSSAKN